MCLSQDIQLPLGTHVYIIFRYTIFLGLHMSILNYTSIPGLNVSILEETDISTQAHMCLSSNIKASLGLHGLSSDIQQSLGQHVSIVSYTDLARPTLSCPQTFSISKPICV
jgi:hypothetical protein